MLMDVRWHVLGLRFAKTQPTGWIAQRRGSPPN
jgi:hypothetical protein